MPKVIHIITGLQVGGAETMLYRLLSRMQGPEFHSAVVCLTDGGLMLRKIEGLGVPVLALGMPKGRIRFSALVRLAAYLRSERPDLVQTWLYHADLIGGIAARLAGCKSVFWNIRHNNIDKKLNSGSSMLALRICAFLSYWLPKAIVCNSRSSRDIHVLAGYAKKKFIVIPNGFDSNRFFPSEESRHRIRRELGIGKEAPLVGLFARLHPQKDHATFFQAAGKLAKKVPDVRFLLCGEGVERNNPVIENWLLDPELDGRVIALGRRDPVSDMMCALDVGCSSSVGEGFPNVIGEMMACGVPCVVTDVGESRELVGETGIVVAPRDPASLAESLFKLLKMPSSEKRTKALAARARIKEEFDLDSIVVRYSKLYLSSLGQA